MSKTHGHIHLQRQHYVKTLITIGCMTSSVLCLIFPGTEGHAMVIATITNVIWVWT